MTGKLFRGLFLGAVLGALLVRSAGLDLRPMHHDEANQAVKFGELLERGDYRYDPQDHHGPSLYYLTLPAARAANERSLPELRETTLRMVPALFGAGIVVLFLLFGGGLSRRAALTAAALAAVSPAMAYYGRFYIQETLLVFFLAGLVAAGWRYSRTRSGWWALAAGVCAGMMFATKETSLILFGALAAALGVGRLFGARGPASGLYVRVEGLGERADRARGRLPVGHIVIFLAAAAAVAAAFFTSFFSHPEGLADSARAVGVYLSRAGGAGVHSHPWSYYLGTLAYSRFAGGPVWSELFVLVLAVIGGLAAFRRDGGGAGEPGLLRFVLVFTLVSAAVYSAIPYKTPWNLLPFYWGALLLAGHGAGVLLAVKVSRLRLVRPAVAILLAAGFVHLAWQGYRANFVDHSSPSNPYVYAQTSPDFLKLVERVEAAAAAAPEGTAMLIKVVAPPDETWPLPWYLRRFTRVGYWTGVEEAGELGDAGAVVSSAAFAEEIGERLGDGFELTYYGLRPEVLLALFVKRPAIF
jgi:uncharacterized protein (TIGR03663 family)